MSDFEYVRQAMEYGASNYILKLSMKVQSPNEALEKMAQELQRGTNRPVSAENTVSLTFINETKSDHPELNKILLFMLNM